MALMDASQPGSLKLYRESAEENRNAEGWHYAHELSDQGPALVRAAEYLADRSDAERPSHAERARVALTRSTPATAGFRPMPLLRPRHRIRRPRVVLADALSTETRRHQTGRSPDPHEPPPSVLRVCGSYRRPGAPDHGESACSPTAR